MEAVYWICLAVLSAAVGVYWNVRLLLDALAAYNKAQNLYVKNKERFDQFALQQGAAIRELEAYLGRLHRLERQVDILLWRTSDVELLREGVKELKDRLDALDKGFKKEEE